MRSNSINLESINLSDIKKVVYYEKPFLTFERLLETYLGSAPRGIRSFITAMQVWLEEKLFLKSKLKNQLQEIQKDFSVKDFILPKLLL